MKLTLATLSLLCIAALPLSGGVLNGSDSAVNNGFGSAGHISGATGIVGSPVNQTAGAAYVYGSLDARTGSTTQTAKLTASDRLSGDLFGSSVASDSSAGLRVLIGAPGDDHGTKSNAGSAYFFRSTSNYTGTLTQNAKLQPETSGLSGDAFGSSVALDRNSNLSTVAIIGSPGLDFFGNSNRGLVYLFTNLDLATGTVNENAYLFDSGGAIGDSFGTSVAVDSQTSALVGAIGDNSSRGSACYFQDISTIPANLLISQTSKLTASDGAIDDYFGSASGLSYDAATGSRYAVIGAPGDDMVNNPDQGSAYLYRIPASGVAATLTQNAKLISSGGDVADYLGTSVSVSGKVALIGAPKVDGPGHACLYLGLDTATGTINESIRIWAQDGFINDKFGSSVALSGDQIMIGSRLGTGTTTASGKAYSVALSDITTLNTNNATRTIELLNLRSRTNWTIGDTLDNMTLTLAANASFEVPQVGTAIHIGRTNAAANNLLIVRGPITNTRSIIVGSGSNSGNELRVNENITADLIEVRSGSILSGSNRTINANVSMNGSVRPGNDAIGTLTIVGDFTWHSNSPWQFNLAAGNVSDRLNLTGSGSDFLRATTTQQRQFDFLGSTQTGTFTLITWTGITNFNVSIFGAINLGAGVNAVFSMVGNSLVVTIAPIQTLTPLEQWRQTHFGTPANTGTSADAFDADSDGLSNLMEYALGTLPNDVASKNPPVLGQASNRLTLSFTPQVITGITYAIETSPNLSDWASTNLTGLTAGNAFTWTDTVTLTSVPRRFIRLKVTYPIIP